MPEIVLDGVGKTFSGHTQAVEDLSITIPDGSFTTFLGPSGCGKTTTLRMIAGLDSPTAGEIRIGDTVAFSMQKGLFLEPAERDLGLVFQSYALWPHFTVAKNITFGLELRSLNKKEIDERLEQIAVALRIDDLLDRYTSELSGGQQQRVAIARVLVMQPSVLLLDEPLSNLDATLRMEMRAELKRLHRETGATIIYVTHDQIEALTMSTHIALMRFGVLQQFAPPLDIYENPCNEFAADFLGSPRINFLEVQINDGLVVWGDLRFSISKSLVVQPRKNIRLGLRAEEFFLSRARAPGSVQGTVTTVLPTGADWFYQVQVNNQMLTIRQNGSEPFKCDETVYVEARPDSVKLFDEFEQAVI